MFAKIWGHIKNAWKACVTFFKKHFHKVAAVLGAGATMCTLEIIGLVVADTLILPMAMTSMIGLILLSFAYFVVIFTSIMVGFQVFELLWEKAKFDEVESPKTVKQPRTEAPASPLHAAAATAEANA